MKSMQNGRDGLVLDIHRFSLHDGPGIRTVVFLKGCSLHCPWCHNPESIHPSPEIAFYKDRCLHCGACREICPSGAHIFMDGIHVYERQKCTGCFRCVGHCNFDSLRKYGTRMDVEEIMSLVEKDRVYYEQSGGGITISGGEPLRQANFTLEILKNARERGIHTCLETSGHSSFQHFERIVPYVDLLLFDIKARKVDYSSLTGGNYEQIWQNLHYVFNKKTQIEIRIPLIPGVNDLEGFQEEIIGLSATTDHKVPIRIMPYHNLGKGKLERFGYEEHLAETPECTQEYLTVFCENLRRNGLNIMNKTNVQ